MSSERGFTVPEVLITLIMLGIVVGAFGSMLITTSKTSNRVREQTVLQAEARAAIDRLTTDFREATNTTATTPIGSVSSTAFTFDSPDRSTPFHLRRISYRLVNGTLERSTTLSTDTDGWPWVFPATPGPWIPELESITTTSPFTFYDATGTPTTTPNAVHSMRLTFTVAPRQTQGGANTYGTVITIRTLS